MVLHRVFPVKSLLDNLVKNWSRNVLPVWLTRDCIQCKFVPWCLLLLYLSYSVQKYCYSLNLFVKCQLWDSERCLVNYWSYGLPVTYEDATSSPAITLGFSTEQDGSNKEVPCTVTFSTATIDTYRNGQWVLQNLHGKHCNRVVLLLSCS